jgi:hypothetical protein
VDVLKSIFDTANPIIGVVHLLPLPTSPRWGGSLEPVIAQAEQEATALAAGGVNALIVENYYDAPFSRDRVDPAVVSAMSVIVQRLKQLVELPLGLNVLRNDGHSAMAIAASVGARFIRVNVLTGVMVTDQGTIEGEAYQLLRYRRELGVEVKIFADVLVKHARPLSSISLTSAVSETVERGLADGIILSGWATGHPPALEDLELARVAAPHTPLLIGSGANVENIASLMHIADGVIVATSLKRSSKSARDNGTETFPVIDPMRVRNFVDSTQRYLKQRQTVHFHQPDLRISSPVS